MPKAPVDPVSIDIEEKISCTMQSDGTLEGMDVQGNMTLEVHTDESSCIRVFTELGDNQSQGIQFKTHPNIDYEASEAFELQNLTIVIPIPGSEPPSVNSCDGEWRLGNQCLVWQVELVDDSNRSGSMEFVLSNVDSDGIYPIEVEFTSPNLFVDLSVAGVVSCADEQPVRYALRSSLASQQYEIVN